METHSDPKEQLAALERALEAAREGEQKCKQELEKLRQRYADDLFEERQQVRQLREDRHRILQDYERLRLQKGGFGLKMLALSGFSGFMSAIVLCALYLWLIRPKTEYEAVFESFRSAHQLTFEIALVEGRFADVAQVLEASEGKPEYGVIRPALEFARKMVGAAERGCGSVRKGGVPSPRPESLGGDR